MPHLKPPGSHHNRAICTAGFLTLAAALTACTSTTAARSPHGAVAASGAAATTLRITGAGSTFDAPFFNLAFTHYQQEST